MAQWLTEVHEDETAKDDDLRALMEYIYRTREDDGMIAAIEEHMAEGLRRKFVSVADRLEARGRAAMLLHMLGRRFGRLPTGVEERVRAGTVVELEAWATRLLDAATLDEVFTAPRRRRARSRNARSVATA